MMVSIKRMETEEEKRQKALVHWQTWQETYADILPSDFMNAYSLDKCQALTYQYPENTLIAIYQNQVVGFSAYGQSEDNDFGEIFAIYLLSSYQGKGIGYQLLTETLRHMEQFKDYCLWVLEENTKAIAFYQRCGFAFDGESKELHLGRAVTAVKMVLKS